MLTRQARLRGVAHIIVDYDFASPRPRVFAQLAEHENLEATLGATITRVRDGSDGTRNGVGSTRRLKAGPLPPFEETITEVRPDELIRYAISSRSLLTGHEGVMWFSDTPDGGTHLHWEIVFGSRIPGLAAIGARGLRRSIPASFPALDAAARAQTA
jgi:uncharacterized protein YndB with AHSA1/START domain